MILAAWSHAQSLRDRVRAAGGQDPDQSPVEQVSLVGCQVQREADVGRHAEDGGRLLGERQAKLRSVDRVRRDAP